MPRPAAPPATGVKRPRAAEQAEDPRDAELRELRAKLHASEAGKKAAVAAKPVVKPVVKPAAVISTVTNEKLSPAKKAMARAKPPATPVNKIF